MRKRKKRDEERGYMSEQEEREMLERGIRDLEKRIENIDIILKKKNGKAEEKE